MSPQCDTLVSEGSIDIKNVPSGLCSIIHLACFAAAAADAVVPVL